MLKINDSAYGELPALSEMEDQKLCRELREFLVQHVSKTGGHLASNLGIVEVTVAIHKVFDTRRDRLVFDVGHQSYVHKILTGRADQFDTLRQYGGIAGFPKPCESEHDAFVAGHASGAISAALGMARARTLQGGDYSVIALLGDGAITGGLTYEGLSDAAQSGEPLIIILNDNGMSIGRNVGGMARHLEKVRTKPSYYQFKKTFHAVNARLPGGKWLDDHIHRAKEKLRAVLLGNNVFEDMGFVYLGPVDGHDIRRVTYFLQRAKELQKPVVLHVKTVKGKGYAPAEQQPDAFHGIGPFDPATGALRKAKKTDFSAVFGETLCALAARDQRICAVSAAMTQGTGLSGFAKQFPRRFRDVGIAEEHAVVMAAGMAKQGMIPVVAIYSTFLQRAYDMLLQEVGLQQLHLVLAVDRAGLVGEDGETHHGVYDIGFLRQIPGIRVYCPANFAELRAMLEQAALRDTGPVAIRYPRGGEPQLETGGSPILRAGTDLTLVTYGTLIAEAAEAAELLAAQGVSAEVIRLPMVSPLDLELVMTSVAKTGALLVAEETAAVGCVGTELLAEAALRGLPCRGGLINLGSGVVTHGAVSRLRQAAGLDGASIAARAMEVLRNGEKGTH